VRPQKSQKIDLTKEYPCPCRRRGRLLPIMLTEAFGCDRCQQIFVVDEKKQVIEQLSTNYPYKRAWRWTGSRWNAASYGLGETGLSALFTIVILLVIFVFYLALRPLAGLSMIWTTLPVFLVVISLLALMFWLANRY
jgi:hypothetical protein